LAGRSRGSGIFSWMVITKFFIDKARYRAGDDEGNRIVVEVDYDGGSYEIMEEERVGARMEDLKKKMGEAAADMLARKHRVNLSDRLKV